jgi:hypothetical protein
MRLGKQAAEQRNLESERRRGDREGPHAPSHRVAILAKPAHKLRAGFRGGWQCSESGHSNRAKDGVCRRCCQQRSRTNLSISCRVHLAPASVQPSSECFRFALTNDLICVAVQITTNRPSLEAGIAAANSVAPFLDTYRTMCFAPPPDFRRVLEEVSEIGFSDYGESTLG